MVILKRFEVWLFLCLVGGLVYLALKGEAPVSPEPESDSGTGEAIETVAVSGEGEDGTAPGSESAAEPPLVRVEEVVVEESEGGRIVEVTLAGRSGGESAVPLTEDKLSASTVDGEPVPRFFAPFAAAAVLDAEEETLASVRFWLTGEANALVLRYRGRELEVDLTAAVSHRHAP